MLLVQKLQEKLPLRKHNDIFVIRRKPNTVHFSKQIKGLRKATASLCVGVYVKWNTNVSWCIFILWPLWRKSVASSASTVAVAVARQIYQSMHDIVTARKHFLENRSQGFQNKNK